MIEVRNLTFSYSKDKQALHGLDFTVEDGEIFGFLGPNGSGKSTTQKILTGILKGHGGKVSLFGQDISAAHGQEFFQKIGVLFEFPYLYANLSAVDNLNYFASFYPKERRRDVGELLDTLEFKTDFLKKPVSSYSKGMRQRVSMARALVSNPRRCFWTNPPAALTPPARCCSAGSSSRSAKRGRRSLSLPTIWWTLTSCATGWHSSWAETWWLWIHLSV